MALAAGDSELALVRERILRAGPEPLQDAELLAVLIGSGRCDALQSARALLADCGGLRGLLGASLPRLARAPGLGPARAARLIAALELGRRYLEAPLANRRALTRPTDAADCFKARLGDLGHEVFGCLYLDTRHRMICFEALFRGTVDGATVYPREVLKRALYHNAAAVILGHNHPSGDCEPSEADRHITERLAKALALVDIRLLDHLVVATGRHVSLAERGWI